MTRPRLIVHIGSPRTGSSSLQRGLRDAREILLAEGVLYPSLERGRHPFKHASIARAIQSSSSENVAAERDALLAEFAASKAHTMILSDETWWRSDPEVLNFFASLKENFQVEAVAFVRRQDAYLESLYNHALRAGDTRERRTIDLFWRDPAVKKSMEYHRILDSWSKAVHQVRAIEHSQALDSGGLVTSFFRSAGLLVATLPAENQGRPSPDGQAVLTLRMLREAQLSFEAGPLMVAAATLKDAAQGPSPVRHLLGRSERAALMASCRDDRRSLERDYGVSFPIDQPNEAADPLTKPTLEYLLALVAKLTSGDSKARSDRQQRRRKAARGDALAGSSSEGAGRADQRMSKAAGAKSKMNEAGPGRRKARAAPSDTATDQAAPQLAVDAAAKAKRRNSKSIDGLTQEERQAARRAARQAQRKAARLAATVAGPSADDADA